MNITPQPPLKADLRQRFRARRVALSPSERHAAASALRGHLSGRPQLKDVSGAIAVYLANSLELDLTLLIEALLASGRAMVAPYGEGFARLGRSSDFHRDSRGIAQPDGAPVEITDIGLFLIPGVAFAATGERLGQGGGWYDRALSRRNSESLCIGVAFDEQLAEELPCEPHDIAMDYLATPSRFIDCAQTRVRTGAHGC